MEMPPPTIVRPPPLARASSLLTVAVILIALLVGLFARDVVDGGAPSRSSRTIHSPGSDPALPDLAATANAIALAANEVQQTIAAVLGNALTPTAGAMRTPSVPDCLTVQYNLNALCRWVPFPTGTPTPTPTQVYPIPPCETPDPHQVCVWTTPRPTPEPSYYYPHTTGQSAIEGG